MRIVLLGSPGVGKGTYADALSKKFGIPHISTGNMLREEIKKGTKEGEEAGRYIEKGNLVPDELTTGILKKRLKKADAQKGFLLDGYPRNLQQAELLKKTADVQLAVNFEADDNTIMARLGGRLTCRQCGAIYHKKNNPPKKEGACDICGGELYVREDQKPEVIKQRLKTYREQTKPLISYYKKQGVLFSVSANPPIEEIHKIIDPVSRQMENLK